MSKHTEVPWRIAAESGNSGEAYAIESKGRTICWTACSLDKDGNDIITEEDKAIADLIAEAPALLAGLEEAIEQLYIDGAEEMNLTGRFRHLEEIIFRAKGVKP